MRAGGDVGPRRGFPFGFVLFFPNLRETGECHAVGSASVEKERQVLGKREGQVKEGEGKRPDSIATPGAWAGRGEGDLNPQAGAPLFK